MFITGALVQSLRVFGLAASVLLRPTPLGDSVSVVSPVLCYSQESSIAHKLLTMTTLSVRNPSLSVGHGPVVLLALSKQLQPSQQQKSQMRREILRFPDIFFPFINSASFHAGISLLTFHEVSHGTFFFILRNE